MGGGGYNFTSRSTRAATMDYMSTDSSNLGKTFTQKSKGRVHESLNPAGVTIRESRDSDEHPHSYAILIGIDWTGSMGNVPAKLVRDGLPHMIQQMFDNGIPDPQVGFIGIGDHECDRVPLQVGQFESSDELLDKSLTAMYPEGGGGGNGGESYLLAWYHAAFHTSIDCFEKRGQKGLLITIGDEPCLNSVPGQVLQDLYKLGERPSDYSAKGLLAAAQKTYDVYHINVQETSNGQSRSTQGYWPDVLGSNFINAESAEDIPRIIGDIANRHYIGTRKNMPAESTSVKSSEVEIIL